MYNGLYPPPLWTSNQNNLINNNDKKKQSSGFSIKSGNKYFFDMNNIILNEEDSQIKNEENKNDDNKNKENKEDNNIEEKEEKIKFIISKSVLPGNNGSNKNNSAIKHPKLHISTLLS